MTQIISLFLVGDPWSIKQYFDIFSLSRCNVSTQVTRSTFSLSKHCKQSENLQTIPSNSFLSSREPYFDVISSCNMHRKYFLLLIILLNSPYIFFLSIITKEKSANDFNQWVLLFQKTFFRLMCFSLWHANTKQKNFFISHYVTSNIS